MSLVHKKKSIVDDTASTAEIKGADWNAEHCFGAGSFVPVGLLVLNFDADGFASVTGFGGVSAGTRVGAGAYTASAALAPETVADGCFINYIGVISIAPVPAALSSLLISSGPYISGGGIWVEITDSELAGVDPTVVTSICVTVYASITVRGEDR